MHRSTLGTMHLAVAALEVLGVLGALGTFLVAVGVCSGIGGAVSADGGDGWLPGLAVGAGFGVFGGLVFLVLAAALGAVAVARAVAGVTLRRDGPAAVPVVVGVVGLLVPVFAGVALLAMSPVVALALVPFLLVWVLASVLLLALVIGQSAQSA